MKGKIIALVLAMLLVMTVASPAVLAAPEGQVTGRFGINAPPTITSVSLTPTAVTPQTSSTVSVVVSDSDNISDLSTLVVKVRYDADGGIPTVGEFDAASAGVQTAVAIVTWTHTGGNNSTTVLTPAATTWSVSGYTVPTTNGNFNGTSFTFSFPITIGKVATETSGSALWQIDAKATDSVGQTAYNYDAEGAAMNWYGEITVPAGTLDWGSLPPGSDFAATSKPFGSTIAFVANGPYDERVRSSASWTGATYTATLDATGAAANAGQFSLRADDTSTLGSAVLVDSTGVTVDDTGVQTAEAGDSAANYYLWLKLAPVFNKDVYNGTITFIVANGT